MDMVMDQPVMDMVNFLNVLGWGIEHFPVALGRKQNLKVTKTVRKR